MAHLTEFFRLFDENAAASLFKNRFFKKHLSQEIAASANSGSGGSGGTFSRTAPDGTTWYIKGVSNEGALVTTTVAEQAATDINNLPAPDGSFWYISGISNGGGLITTKK